MTHLPAPAGYPAREARYAAEVVQGREREKHAERRALAEACEDDAVGLGEGVYLGEDDLLDARYGLCAPWDAAGVTGWEVEHVEP